MKKLFLFFLLAFFSFHSFSQIFKRTADSLRRYRSVPGLVYAVVTADSIIEMHASGVRKYKTRDSIRISDRFHIGTNTTTFTTYLAARMAEAGKISWSANIIKLLPELNGTTMKVNHKLTLRQLLSQRTGIKPYTAMEDFKGMENFAGTGIEQRKAFAATILKEKPILLLDSSKASFSMAGTAIAAAMLEKAGGKKWEDLVDQYIAQPLKISVKYGLPNYRDSTQPSGHWDKYSTLSAEAGDSWIRFIPAVAPAVDINISLPHYAKFMQDILKALANKKSMISNKSANELLFGFKDYSMGWENFTWNKMNVAYAFGKGLLFSSYVEIIKEKNIAIIVMCNSGAVNGKATVLNFGRMLREHYSK